MSKTLPKIDNLFFISLANNEIKLDIATAQEILYHSFQDKQNSLKNWQILILLSKFPEKQRLQIKENLKLKGISQKKLKKFDLFDDIDENYTFNDFQNKFNLYRIYLVKPATKNFVKKAFINLFSMNFPLNDDFILYKEAFENKKILADDFKALFFRKNYSSIAIELAKDKSDLYFEEKNRQSYQ